MNTQTLPRLAITAGEPAGIGPELIIRLAATPLAANFVAVTDRALLQRAAQRCGQSIELIDDDGSDIAQRTPGQLRVKHMPLGTTETPVGSSYPPNSIASVSRRMTTEITGRSRSVSWIVAVR